MDKTLVIFLTNGNTLFFENVRDFIDDGLNLKFNYFGKSTETKRKAKFDGSKILGYAISTDEESSEADQALKNAINSIRNNSNIRNSMRQSIRN